MTTKDKSRCGRERQIYSVFPQGQPYYIKGDGDFIPIFDTTDHFHFACRDCQKLVEILMVRRHDAYADTPTIYFYMRCPKCGKEGQMKTYLEEDEGHFLRYPTQHMPLPDTLTFIEENRFDLSPTKVTEEK